MILTSPSLASLAPALVAAQAEMPTVPKTAAGQVRGKTDYRYADLDAIWTTIRPLLREHGLAVTQFPCLLPDEDPGLVTMLLHTSGEWMAEEMPLAVEAAGPQAQGSGITYARRYALCAVLGIVADEDDDGAGAQGSRGASGPAPASGAGSGESPSTVEGATSAPPAWHRDLMAALSKVGLGGDSDKQHEERMAFIERVTGKRLPSSRDLTAIEAGKVIRATTGLAS